MNNEKELYKKRAKKVMDNLKLNNINSFYLDSSDDLHKLLNELILDSQTVGFGGSKTLDQTGTLDYLRNRNVNLLDRYKEGLTKNDIDLLMRKCFFADVYLSSTNAITEDGKLYNVDCNGNRVAPIIYGPKKVIIISGVNKIVKRVKDAVLRVRNYAAPLNSMRLDCNTPCKSTGECMDCLSDDRICCSYVTLSHQRYKDRINVILINDNLGF